MVDESTDLDVIFPDREIIAAGEKVTVSEYSFMDGLTAGYLARDLIEDLGELFVDRENPEQFSMSELGAVFGKHRDVVSDLLALSVGRDVGWVRTLDDNDGQTLLLVWWVVNKNFFIRRLVQKMGLTQAAKMAAQTSDRSAGAKYSPDSPGTTIA